MTKLEILLLASSSSKQVKHDIYRREAIRLLIDRNGQKTGHFFDKQLKLNFWNASEYWWWCLLHFFNTQWAWSWFLFSGSILDNLHNYQTEVFSEETSIGKILKLMWNLIWNIFNFWNIDCNYLFHFMHSILLNVSIIEKFVNNLQCELHFIS